MADNTKIEWTDATWNPITGCSIVSPGCTNCYAMKLAGTRLKHIPSREGLTKDTKAGPVWTGEVRFNEKDLDQPLRWKRPRMIFVCAHGDLFAENVPDEWIDSIFAIIASSPQHTFQVLTKRPERMRQYINGLRDRASLERFHNPLLFLQDQNCVFGIPRTEATEWPLPNVWLGVSVEDQKRADERINPMAGLAQEGWLTWVSYEPALGAVDWQDWWFLKWMVAGGESGSSARPMHPDWARAARDHCRASGIAFHFKQWGTWAPAPWKLDRLTLETDSAYIERSETEGATHAIAPWPNSFQPISHRPWSIERARGEPYPHVGLRKLGKKAAGRLLDGVTHDAFPQVRS